MKKMMIFAAISKVMVKTNIIFQHAQVKKIALIFKEYFHWILEKRDFQENIDLHYINYLLNIYKIFRR